MGRISRVLTSDETNLPRPSCRYEQGGDEGKLTLMVLQLPLLQHSPLCVSQAGWLFWTLNDPPVQRGNKSMCPRGSPFQR